MARLSALPQELCLQVSEYLKLSDKAHLSATCKGYRALLSPEIFKAIRFTNTEASARSALAAVEAHGGYTVRIKFTCRSGLYDKLTAPALPPAASKVLKGHLTPNLLTVRLKFDFDFEEYNKRTGDPFALFVSSMLLFEEAENDDVVREEEQEWKWRALMKETWQALAANSYVRRLIVNEFIPKWTSIFRTDEFRQFLSRLESATFDIFGMEDGLNGSGQHTNTQDGYIEFLATLDASFFHHMTGLKHLHIRASDPLGLEGGCHIPLALKPGDLPVLASLKLESCFVGPELVSFIQSHTQVLKSLDIEQCISVGDGGDMGDVAENPLYWVEFFDEIYKAKPSLTELIVGGCSEPLTSEEKFNPDYDYTNEPEVVQDIRRKLESDPMLKLFGHAYVQERRGQFILSEWDNVAQFSKGNDQRAYDRLMGLVKENAARSGQ